jgi:hypothetical protein
MSYKIEHFPSPVLFPEEENRLTERETESRDQSAHSRRFESLVKRLTEMGRTPPPENEKPALCLWRSYDNCCQEFALLALTGFSLFHISSL